jgi:hypothetical protein
MRVWRSAKKTQRMEVNHRIPCRGTHGTVSCDHHLDNLETLCVACHRVLTLADRTAGTLRGDSDSLASNESRPEPAHETAGCLPRKSALRTKRRAR